MANTIALANVGKEMSRPTDEGGVLVAGLPAVVKLVGWASMAMAAVMGIGWWVATDAGLGPDLLMFSLVAAFFCLGLACIVFTGTIEMDSRSVSYRTPLAHHAMTWAEVESIEMEPDDLDPRYQALGKMALVFVGAKKRLSMPGPSYWCGGDGADMRRLLRSQIEERGIEVRKTQAALWKLPKNTRVSRVRPEKRPR